MSSRIYHPSSNEMAGFITVIMLTGCLFADLPINYEFKIENHTGRMAEVPRK